MVEYATHANFHVVTALMLIPVLHVHQTIYLSGAAHVYQVQHVQVATIYKKP